ncbi:hypothetical protein TCAL_03580 [Tigriopus californicus]|uniref:GDP-fucose protein O-fucosyltransferase 1 n=1 Tax=Tigriopus californicus TaxID=6832 RepID=A0A553NES0_TIGCA|nr:GDP-fucose protein O-fucosyltransferase 1-like [Tigriopus californicus]XP_059094422.1 GDP-fucose protein O-fucosyltransferase 1-like [Tigriopus californicus]TRY63944.1 hypothetical protein TCAL_03580 [Tigriopus californicus]|eukprot:TCALIF_03580-PA protein Name:"Similar to O-fut1 GDP-fucose protein O-fucosyltransferase 1 (Drosophila melanogaster)" AED:0.09 eAED:0.09 QI:122/1/1/1/1/1/4/352/390
MDCGWLLISLLIGWVGVSFIASHETVDENGYIVFCPCMGRFGNQVDHYLGALAFAHGLNRTLVLPPWVEYRPGEAKSVQIPFDTYFKEAEVARYHRVILMADFMEQIAPQIWPEHLRTSLCYSHRPGSAPNSCNAKDGNPFGPFWDTFQIEFASSATYGPLHYDVHHTDIAQEWHQRFSATEWPVIAFTGAPAAFPVQKENVPLQKYLVWSDQIQARARAFINEHLSGGPFIGIHLRNGVDWARACEFVKSAPNLFASAQCLGYRNERGSLTEEMCQPSEEIIVKHLRRLLKRMKDVKKVFVASDHDHMTRTLGKYFQKTDLIFIKPNEDQPHVDLAILGRANHFVGNCVSSFSGFVKRERDTHGFPSTFWGYPSESKRESRRSHDPSEL